MGTLPSKKSSGIAIRLALFSIIFVAALVLGFNLDKPFYGYHDWNGITYGQIAKNYVRYGYLATKLGQVENLGPVIPAQFTYDTHYPPLMTIIMSLPVHLFGPQEWAIRLTPVLFSLTSLYLIYLLGQHLANPLTGLIAVLFTLATPIFIYFGKNPVHETLALTFNLLNFYLFLLYLHRPSLARFRNLFIACFLSLLIGWPTYYLVIILALYGWYCTRQRRFLLLFFLPFITLSLHVFHVYLLTGSFLGGGLGSIILYRLNLGPAADAYPLGLSQFLHQYALFSRNMFTPVLLLLAFLGFIFNKSKRLPILILFVAGLAHTLVFPTGGYLHDYLQFPALGALTLSAALFLHRFISSRWFFPLGSLLAIAILFSKLPFTLAMITSYMSLPEYQLSQEKVAPLKPGESITITTDEARLLTGVVAPYYLDKPIKTPETVQDDQTYQLLITPASVLIQSQSD